MRWKVRVINRMSFLPTSQKRRVNPQIDDQRLIFVTMASSFLDASKTYMMETWENR